MVINDNITISETDVKSKRTELQNTINKQLLDFNNWLPKGYQFTIEALGYKPIMDYIKDCEKGKFITISIGCQPTLLEQPL